MAVFSVYAHIDCGNVQLFYRMQRQRIEDFLCREIPEGRFYGKGRVIDLHIAAVGQAREEMPRPEIFSVFLSCFRHDLQDLPADFRFAGDLLVQCIVTS